jgi:hypothetical protein
VVAGGCLRHVSESSRNPPEQYRLVTATVRERVPAGTTIDFELAGTLSGHVGVEPTFGIRLQGPDEDDSAPAGDPVSVENVPGEPVALAVRARPEPEPDGRHRVVVFAIDGTTNPVPSFDGVVETSTPRSVPVERPERPDRQVADRERVPRRDDVALSLGCPEVRPLLLWLLVARAGRVELCAGVLQNRAVGPGMEVVEVLVGDQYGVTALNAGRIEGDRDHPVE